MDELIKRLRCIAKVSYGATIEEAREVCRVQREAADALTSQQARITALEDEVKALRKDAERYRWLKSRTRCFSLDMGGRHRYDPSSAFMRLQGPTLDDAFDAAIAKDKAALSAASDGGKENGCG